MNQVMTEPEAASLVQPPLGEIIRRCPATRAASVIGDGWIQLILREMFAGQRRFSDFAAHLGISRAVLADRLRRLVEAGLVEQEPARHDGGHRNYGLTAKGRDTIGIMLMQDAWEQSYGSSEKPLDLVDRDNGLPTRPVLLTHSGGQPIEARRLSFVFDGGAAGEPEPASNARRRGEGAQPSAEFGAISVLGDPWSWRILIAAIMGVRRFDEFSQVLGISSNVLSDRLGRLVDADVMLRERYSRLPPRYEYRLAVAGRALHPLFCAMYGWGERWLYESEALPMRLFDRITGARVTPVVCDSVSGRPIDAAELQPARRSIAA